MSPSVGLWDQARTIVVSHLLPREKVALTARSEGPYGAWMAVATFEANRAGVVDLARQAPLSGSYRGVSAMGLLWSQRFVASGAGTPSLAAVTTLTVRAGNKALASARLVQRLEATGVSKHAERPARAGFFGQYFAAPGRTRGPGVVLWGGSEGGLGDNMNKATLLASHGVSALALAYFDEPGLPCSLADIPLEYFARAIHWLRSQPQVNPNRVWLISGSRGTEAELLVASHWPNLVHGLIAQAPTSIAYGAADGDCAAGQHASSGTLNGKPIPFDDTFLPQGFRYHADGSVSEVDAFRSGLGLPSARTGRIPVRGIRGPVMLISGGDDQLWPSDTYADQIMTGLRFAPGPHVHLNYPGAGHIVLGIPYSPITTTAQTPEGLLDLGGSRAGDEAAYGSDWPAVITFVSRR